MYMYMNGTQLCDTIIKNNRKNKLGRTAYSMYVHALELFCDQYKKWLSTVIASKH